MAFQSFELHPTLNAALKTQGYEAPTPIQQESIPVILKGHDVLGLAQTGTGKTAAFVLPTLHRLLEGKHRGIGLLIVTPTRELAEQILSVVQDFSKKSKIRSMSIYGGMSMNTQISKLREGVDVVVACPGRLCDHLRRRTIDLSKVGTLVLDEADMLLDMGFFPSVREILKHLPEKRQSLLFSATMPKEVAKLADDVLTNPVRVEIDSSKPITTVSHALYPIGEQKKGALLLALLKGLTEGSVLIFTRTKHRAKNLAAQLDRANFSATCLQGNLSQNQRQAALKGFRSGKFQILVATDIAARGIDVASVSHVINFDIPNTPEAYTHRIGRTGRAAREGDAFTLVTDADRQMVKTIERTLGRAIERRTLEGFEYMGANLVIEETEDRRPAGRGQRPAGRGRSAPRAGQGGGQGGGQGRGGQSRGGQGRAAPSRGRAAASDSGSARPAAARSEAGDAKREAPRGPRAEAAGGARARTERPRPASGQPAGARREGGRPARAGSGSSRPGGNRSGGGAAGAKPAPRTGGGQGRFKRGS